MAKSKTGPEVVLVPDHVLNSVLRAKTAKRVRFEGVGRCAMSFCAAVIWPQQLKHDKTTLVDLCVHCLYRSVYV